jgi:di/tricarboxylate transporter
MHPSSIVFGVLAGAFGMFVWGRFRYDFIALLALLAVVLTGVLPMDQAFDGFAHPAVVTVAAVLVISRALQNAGLVDVVVRLLAPLQGKQTLQLVTQTLVVAVLSAFMNNVGALALMLPVAMRNAYRDGYSPAGALMPLAFGSLLGGLTTLIGTPPNIIISTFRHRELGEAYSMFSFAPVGGVVALAGIAFVVIVGWRLIPKDRRGAENPENLFEVAEYITELRVPEESKQEDATVRDIEALTEEEAVILGIVRGESKRLAPRGYERIRAGDILIVEANSSALTGLIDNTDFVLEADKKTSTKDLGSEEIAIREAIIGTGSRIRGRTPASIRLRARYGVNLLAIARHGHKIKQRLSQTTLQTGDVLLLQGGGSRIQDLMSEFDILPLAERALKIGRPKHLLFATAVFVVAVATVLANLLPVHIAFLSASVALALTNVINKEEIYQAVDWPVIVLLAAMIPVGNALEVTGGTGLIAGGILRLTEGFGPVGVLVVLMIGTMLVSDVINNNATAVLMAPIAIDLATRLGVNMDSFLMAVAIGASCTFLTPIGHQSNTLVLAPGGYRFGDYWRMGLPLDGIIVTVAVSMILIVWPL